jgi:hypothetical protein
MTQDRLEWHLENWATWMKRESNRLGYPSKALCFSSGGSSGADEFQIMCDDSDTRSASIVDKVIDSISSPQRTAINHHWLQVKHHYPTHELDLELAYESIIKILDKRGVV